MAEFELPEKVESRRERVVGLIIAAIAVVLAVVSSLAHETHNDEILAHIDAADQYAFYQAKRERRAQLEVASDAAGLGSDRLSPAGQAQAAALRTGYGAEEKRLVTEGTAIQHKGDELMAESKRLEAKARVLDLAEIALQIAVVVCSISVLTEQRLFVVIGVGMAVVGIFVAVTGLLMR
jgi:hypothetical protein